jgi:catechol 2,3-dioxygenase-like lactoylglutathione lyase family enzyme
MTIFTHLQIYLSTLKKGKRNMKPRITVITIGVDDLERSLAFYRDGLGLKTDGIVGEEFEYGAVVFIDLENGAKLALWPRRSIAHDSGLSLQNPSATEFSVGHNLNSKKEVNEVMAQAKKAGARIVKPAQETFWGGYAGCFQDADGHLWEVAWNPAWKIED